MRLRADSLGGLSTASSIDGIKKVCPHSRVDTVGVGGMAAPALRVDGPGVTLWAIQSSYDAYGDSLRAGEPADLWAASGDSLRFPDGTLIPGSVGALRAIDSAGIIVVDRGDDGSGSYIVRCKFPHLALIVDNVWPPFAEVGTVPLARASTRDTTRVWRVEIEPHRKAPAVKPTCPR